MWKDLSYYSEFALDTSGMYTNNLCYALAGDDLWLLAVLNSPAAWSYLWRHALHGKDAVLRLQTPAMRAFPIPPAPADRERVEREVRRCIGLANEAHSQVRGLHEWLRVEFGVETIGNALEEPAALEFDSFAAEVRKRRSGRHVLGGAEVRRLREEFDRTMPALQGIATRSSAAESVIADAVFRAYGLDQAAVELLWKTAPPRVPGAAPLPVTQSE